MVEQEGQAGALSISRGTRAAGLIGPLHIVIPRKTYYVNDIRGNDANHGRTPDQAWQTVAKVNGESFSPGDRILFRRGGVWIGTEMQPPSSGEPGRPITFNAYGSGARPVIDGNDAVDCIHIGGRSYIVIRDIEFTQGLDFGIYVTTGSSYIDVIDCVAHDCGNDNILFSAVSHHCTVKNCISYDPYERVPGPRITCLEVTDGSHDITITDFEGYGSESAGISIHSHPATELPYNITLVDCSLHDNDEFGIVLTQDNAGAVLLPDVAIHVTNCQFNDNAGGVGTGAAIWLSITGDPYPAGIVFDRCECFSAADRPLLVGGRAEFTQCVFRADTGARIDGGEADHNVFTNCTFYRTGGPTFETGNNPDDLVMRNCIVAGGSTIYNIRAGTTNVDIDYTLYWSFGFDIMTVAIMGWLGVFHDFPDWLINSGMDPNSPTPANPLFVDVANNNFRLQAASPARGVGIELGFGTDLGAYQYVA